MKASTRRAGLVSTAAVAATAVIGSIGVDPNSPWYKSLHKPTWQPPPAAFGAVWTPLYGLIALSGTRVLARTGGRPQREFATVFALDLGLNAGWNWLFFKARRPDWALAELAALQVCNVALTSRAARHDRTAAAALLPYVAWTGFAAALNTSIVRRNRAAGQQRTS